MTTKRPSLTDEEALAFHRYPRPGKLSVTPTKPMATQKDLSLAYSPGVAVPVLAIAKDPDAAYDYTSKGNMVAVISNGTAILGLGNLGALASKPVMEGKSVLFKRFADVDSIDVELTATDAAEGHRLRPDAVPGFANGGNVSASACTAAARTTRRCPATGRCSN